MSTIIGYILSDVASLLTSEPYNLFLGFAILGCVFSIIIGLYRHLRW